MPKTITIILLLIFNTISFSQTLLPGFPKILDTLDGSSGGAASSIIADFDRDGFNELLCGVCNELNTGKVFLVSHNSVIKPGWPKIIRNLFNYINTAAGDLNRDGYIDIIVRVKDSVYAFDYSGNNLPGFPVYFGNGNVYYHEDPLGLYDMNNDGYPEIIAYCDNRVCIFDRYGNALPGWPKTINLGGITFLTHFTLGDIDNDGLGEVIIPACRVSTAPGPGTIFVFRHDGQNYCPPFVLDSTYYSGFSNAVIYRNSTSGAKNIILSSNYSVNSAPNTFRIRINEFNHNFQQLSSAYVFNSFWEAYEISAAYLNTGNVIDVLFTNSAFCYALNAPGGVLGGFPVPASNANANKSVLCGYLSQNKNVVTSLGMAEYDDKITDTVKGFIKVFKYNGTEESWSPLRPKGIVNSAPTICDLNKDGKPDLAAVSSYSYSNGSRGTIVYVWTFLNAAYLNDSADWHMLRHDMYRTNQNGFRPKELVSGISPLNTVIPSSFSLSQNYSNPFNPATKIKFSIPNSTPLAPLLRGTVLLAVYDVTGKEVAVLVNEVLQPGTYEVTFDGSELTSGVYFYKLQAGDYTETKRMVLIK